MAHQLVVLNKIDEIRSLIDMDRVIDAVSDAWSYAHLDETIVVVPDEDRQLASLSERLACEARKLGLRRALAAELFLPDQLNEYAHLSFVSIERHTDGHLLVDPDPVSRALIGSHWRSMHLVLDGKFTVRAEGLEPITVEEGDVFLMSPMLPHAVEVLVSDEDGNEVPASTVCIELMI